MGGPDWDAEGLLAGLESDEERDGRRELLDRLHAEGCSVEELRQAVRDDRIALLPVEKLLLRNRRYTMRDISERTGVSEEYLRADRRAMGLPDADPDEPLYAEESLTNFEGIKFMRDAGVTEAQMLELTRIVGDASAKLADATLRTLGLALLEPGSSERDLSLRLVDVANALMPHASNMLRVPLEVHLAEIVRHEAIGRLEREHGLLPGARRVAVCFADMVGYTELTEHLDVDELGEVAQRFSDVAASVASAPVRLVKTIGDEAMLASEDPQALVSAAVDLLEAAAADDLLPPLRAGGALGPALRRAGDYYGRSVNLAARITTAAPEGGLLANDTLREATRGSFDWSAAGRQEFKGIEGDIELYRLEALR